MSTYYKVVERERFEYVRYALDYNPKVGDVILGNDQDCYNEKTDLMELEAVFCQK